MEKFTILAKLQLTIRLTDEIQAWMHETPDVPLYREGGDEFLNKFGGVWTEIFAREADAAVVEFFRARGMNEDLMPRVQISETYRGSFIIAAAIVIAASVSTAFNVLKGASELPEISNGLVKLKDRILGRSAAEINREMSDRLRNPSPRVLDDSRRRVVPPSQPADVSLTIDSRPILALTSATLQSHKVHLSVAVSRGKFVLENLSDGVLQDLHIGLFQGSSERHQWSFGDAFRNSTPVLSGHQTIALDLNAFKDSAGMAFSLPDSDSVYVDCWVQDTSGIYLFRFFLTEA